MEIGSGGRLAAKSEKTDPFSNEWLGSANEFETAPEKLRQSPHFSFYVDAIKAGWSTRLLAKKAKQLFNEDISDETFRKLALLVPKTEKLDPTYNTTVLKDIDAFIDVMTDMPNVIEVQKKRVTNAIQFEGSLAVGKGGGVIPLKSTTDEITTLWQMLKDYGTIMINLGLLPRGQTVREIDASERAGVLDVEAEIIDLRNKLTDEQYIKLIQVSQEISGIILAHFLGSSDGVVVEEFAVAEID